MIDDSMIGPRVRTVLAAANDEAARLCHHYVSTEHMLLGLLDEGEGVGVTVLKNLGVDLENLRLRAESTVKPGPPENAALVKRPFTARAKRALDFAAIEARAFGHQYLATEHLILGLIVEEYGIAGEVLHALGVRADVARAETARVLGASLPPVG
jgi:ATP-dependent Clp protease ATP-binding subunit ClpC